MEHLRESLLGTYDIYMGRLAQRSNDVMKALTVLSAILLPSVVLAGVMGMNFKVWFFDDPSSFFVVVAAMGLMAVAISGSRAGGAGSPTPRDAGLQSASTCRVKPNSEPPAGRGMAQIRPPIAAMRRAQTKSPIPAPPAAAVPADRKKSSNRRSDSSAGKPGPSSRIRTSTSRRRSPRRLDRRPGTAVLGGVRQQVAEDLLDVGRVGDGRRQARRRSRSGRSRPASGPART